jgi:hypothetical protein
LFGSASIARLFAALSGEWGCRRKETSRYDILPLRDDTRPNDLETAI